MSSTGGLLGLLPALYRERDKHGHDLAEFVGVLQAELDRAARDIDALYDDAFIETCDQSVVPFIGALVGIADAGDGRSPSRAVVGNAMLRRRQKGSLEALILAVNDSSGWQVRASEGESVDGNHERTVGLEVWTRAWYPLNSVEFNPVVPGGYHLHPFAIDAPVRLGIGISPVETVPLICLLGSDEGLRPPTASEPESARVVLNGSILLRGQIAARDLSGWERPERDGPVVAFVDLDRGRLTVAPGRRDRHNRRIFVDFWYPFGSDIGGGPYPRPVTDAPRGTTVHRIDRAGHRLLSLAGAFELLRMCTEIVVEDNGLYNVDALIVVVPASGWVRVRAAPGCRPTLVGDLVIAVGAFSTRGATVELDGLVICGGVFADSGIHLTLRDCTVRAPTDVPLCVVADRLVVERSLVGQVCASVASITDSIVDGASSVGELRTDGSTFLGMLATSVLNARSSVFADPVSIADVGSGRASLCWIAAESDVPDRCDGRIVDDCGNPQPALLSRQFGDPNYGLVTWSAPVAARTAGHHGGEVGAHSGTDRFRRLRALMATAAEFVPFGYSVEVRIVA